jgi:hypothetical protein
MKKKILIISLVAVGFLAVFSVQNVFAANVWGWAWAYPEGGGTDPTIGWIAMSSPNKWHWQLVDEYPSDSNATYIYTNSTTEQKDVYKLQDPYFTGSILSVAVHGEGGGNAGAGIRLGGVEVGGMLFSIVCPGTICVSSDVNIVSKPGGGSWGSDMTQDYADLRDMQLGVSLERISPNPSALTQAYVKVTTTTGVYRLFPNGVGDYTNIDSGFPAPTGPGYGVSIDDATGVFSGWGWSENVGWISFNKEDLNDCPSGTCEAKITLTGPNAGKVTGWAKPLLSKTYEYFSNAVINPQSLFGIWWKAQTFTVGNTGPNEDFNIVSTKIKVYRTGSPGTVNAVIRNVDGSGHPTGSDLCSGSINGNSFVSYSPAQWYEIGLRSVATNGCRLTSGTKYTLIINASSGNGSSLINWEYDSADIYTGGNRESSSNSGATWSADSGDYKFEIIGSNFDNWIKLNPDAAVTASNAVRLVGSEFQGWAFGGGQSNDEALIGLISFNHATGGGAIDYKVETDLNINNPPVAAISCNPASCSVFQGDILTLNNDSTDSDGIADIIQSQWWTKYLANPYATTGPCMAPRCSYTSSLGLGGQPDYVDYTAKLRVTDAGGLFSEAEKTFTIKRVLSVDFQCKLKVADPWQSCTTLNPVSGDIILLDDISNPSYVSTGSSITSRIWNKNDIDGNFDFSVSNNPNPNVMFKAPTSSLTLTVIDSAGKTGSMNYVINGKLSLPTWKEVNPAW